MPLYHHTLVASGPVRSTRRKSNRLDEGCSSTTLIAPSFVGSSPIRSNGEKSNRVDVVANTLEDW